MGVAIDSLVSPGVIVSGGRVQRSVLSPGVRVNSYCEIEDSILLDKVQIGRYSRLRKCIVDEGTVLPEKTVAGEDPAADLAREAEQAGWDGFFVWDGLHPSYPAEAVPMTDVWIALTAAAMTTQRIRLGPMLTPLARRRQ